MKDGLLLNTCSFNTQVETCLVSHSRCHLQNERRAPAYCAPIIIERTRPTETPPHTEQWASNTPTHGKSRTDPIRSAVGVVARLKIKPNRPCSTRVSQTIACYRHAAVTNHWFGYGTQYINISFPHPILGTTVFCAEPRVHELEFKLYACRPNHPHMPSRAGAPLR